MTSDTMQQAIAQLKLAAQELDQAEPLRACHACGTMRRANTLLACAACQAVHYCGTACQARDWTEHGHWQVCGTTTTVPQQQEQEASLEPNNNNQKNNNKRSVSFDTVDKTVIHVIPAYDETIKPELFYSKQDVAQMRFEHEREQDQAEIQAQMDAAAAVMNMIQLATTTTTEIAALPDNDILIDLESSHSETIE